MWQAQQAIKLMEDSWKKLQEVQKEVEEQQKLTNYQKRQNQELRGKMAEDKQAWENKYEADTKERSQEVAELKIKLRAEKIERTKLQAENQSVRDAIRALEQSLEEHKDYIVKLREDNVKQTVEYDRALVEAWRDRED